ncbi:acyltransferase family protein [Streptomyces sp. 7-21]|uniref:acyltransferase family protein n=1 Tax=Streptomyces sp. 7-21 TaxID=2802283 RepID=UPI00191F7FCF|nr:acyltransferase family protein [Streptomyces sp. 7-21]MBL1066509.1 acyltransferase family protein [Streptomyces sp. 7-21]
MLHVRNQRAQSSAPRGNAADPPLAVTDGPARVKPRDPYFDNAKYLAIVLVALGHCWTPLRDDSRTAAALYLFVYAFHMPAFILIAGYFSRTFTARPDQLKRLVSGVAVPYLIFEVAYVLFMRWASDSETPPLEPFSLLDPYYVTWFLAALFVWRLTSPLWRIVRWPVPVSLAIAAVGAVSPQIGADLNLQRVLQFLPFFVIGLHLRREHFTWLCRPVVRAVSVPVFLAALACAYWAVPRMNHAWFYRSDAAQELAAPWWTGILMSLALFGCGLLLTACFLAWVPRRQLWMTALGAGTIYGYLLHGFIAKASRWWGWYDAEWVTTPAGEVAVTLMAAVLITALCTAPVRKVFRIVIEPTMDWAFKPDRPRPSPSAPPRPRAEAHAG